MFKYAVDTSVGIHAAQYEVCWIHVDNNTLHNKYGVSLQDSYAVLLWYIVVLFE